MGDGSELLSPGSVRAIQEMLSLSGESSDASQYGRIALIGTSRELSVGAGGDLQRVSASRREHLENLLARGYKCLFYSDGLGCVEIASEFCPRVGTLNGVPIFPGYYCLQHAYLLFGARRKNALEGEAWSEEAAAEVALQLGKRFTWFKSSLN